MNERELKALAEGAKIIPLTKGKFCIVDAADFNELTRVRWCVGAVTKRREGYAVRCVNKKLIYMHRFLLGFPEGMMCDHKNGDTLDNRRSNLRVATHTQNQHNRAARVDSVSGIKGVNFHYGKWQSKIYHNGKSYWLGRFDTKEEAAEVHRRKAAELQKEYALAPRL